MLLRAGSTHRNWCYPMMIWRCSVRRRNVAKNFVLYFYPKNNTPGRTLEANEFTGMDDSLIRFDTLVVASAATNV